MHSIYLHRQSFPVMRKNVSSNFMSMPQTKYQNKNKKDDGPDGGGGRLFRVIVKLFSGTCYNMKKLYFVYIFRQVYFRGLLHCPRQKNFRSKNIYIY